MLEWDEIVAFDAEDRMIGRIGSKRQKEVKLAGLPNPYWRYNELFENEKAQMMPPRQTVDHGIDLKD